MSRSSSSSPSCLCGSCYAEPVSRPAPYHSYTFRDYLDLEATANVKHEFFNGEIYAMAGGTPQHAVLTMAIGQP